VCASIGEISEGRIMNSKMLISHRVEVTSKQNGCGLTLASGSAPHSCLLRIGRVKVRKLTGWDKDSLVGKQKPCKQNKKFIHYFPSAGRCSAISRKAGLHHA